MLRVADRYIRRVLPARYRACLALYTEARCDPISRCARQAKDLLALLLRYSHGADARPEDVMIAECVAMLDGAQRRLSSRSSDAMALATIKEALMQARESVHQHDVAHMPRVVAYLERLEECVLRHECVNDGGCVEHELELLCHLGRGLEMLRRKKKTEEDDGILSFLAQR